MSWRVEPLELGRTILRSYTEVMETADGYLVTAFDEKEIPKWNAALTSQAVQVIEMNRRLPTLEDLFLELTDGGGVDVE